MARPKDREYSATRKGIRGRRAAGIWLFTSSVLLACGAFWGPQPAAAAVGQMPAASLVIGPAVQLHLLTLFAAYRQVPLTSIAPAASGPVLGAQLQPSGQEWAMVHWQPSGRAAQKTAAGFQDGAGTGIFTRWPGGAWTVAGLGGQPAGCAVSVPQAVRQLWHLPGCLTLAGQPAPRVLGPVAGTTRSLVKIALAQVGVADNPPVTSFDDLDCNPYTTLVGNPLDASSQNCKTSSNEPYFGSVQDVSEFWCADFTKWVWQQAGVTSGLGTLSPSAASFYTWGADHGEHIRFSGTAKVGDAVILYPPGTTAPNGSYADHVGIVTAVHANGTVNLVNGDFLGPTNISVQYNTNVHLATWASEVEGNKGEKWAFVSPLL